MTVGVRQTSYIPTTSPTDKISLNALTLTSDSVQFSKSGFITIWHIPKHSKQDEVVTNMNKQTTTFEDVKLGDRLFSIGLGWGTVVVLNVDYMPTKLIKFGVDFATGSTVWYSPEGKVVTNDYNVVGQTVFWDEVKIRAPVKPKVAPVKDVLVKCYAYSGAGAILRYSTGIVDEYGNLVCYDGGCTSKTYQEPMGCGGRTTSWRIWEIADEQT